MRRIIKVEDKKIDDWQHLLFFLFSCLFKVSQSQLSGVVFQVMADS